MSLKKWKSAILGCGNIAGGYDQHSENTILTHARAYQLHPQVDLSAAFDTNRSQLQKFSTHWQIPKQYTELNDLLVQEKPEIVSICSPNETHFSLLMRVAEANPKAILCEKPLAMRLEEAEEMVRVCRSRSIALVVNYMRRWDPTLEALGKRIRAGEFGRAQNARVYYTKGVFHNASHALNLLEAWFGPAEKPHVYQARAWEKEDLSASFHLSFANCSDIVFQACDADHFNFFEIELIFARARILLRGGGNSIQINWAEASPLVKGTFVPSEKSELIQGTLSQAMKFVVANLVDHLGTGEALKMQGVEAVETIRVCERVRKAAEKIFHS